MSLKYPDIILDSLENGHMIIDEHFIITYWNRWLVINTQITKEQIIGKSLKEFYPDLNYKVLHRKIKTALTLKTPSFYDTNSNIKFISINRNKVTTSSLTLMQQQVTVSPYIIEEQKVMISIYDISELYETKLSLKKEINKVNKLNNKLEAEQEVIDKNIMTMKTTKESVITDASTLFCQFFEYDRNDVIGKKASMFKSGDVAENTYKELWKTILSKQAWSGEIKNRTGKGSEKWVQSRITPALDDNGEIAEFNAVYHDITNAKLLAELYIRDSLTKLYNREHFDEVMNTITQHQRKQDTDFVLVITDVDHFKMINDNFGHQVGDEALIAVANTLKNSLRENDLIARWGGEEFVIMLKGVTIEQATNIIEKVRTNLEKITLNQNINLTASFGVTKYIVGEKSGQTFKRVDDALYEAKKTGRNKVVVK